MAYDPYQRPSATEFGEPPRRPARWPYAVLAGAVLLFGGAVWTAYDRGVLLKDSGVEACEALRDGNSQIKNDAGEDEQMTEAQYRELREVFADSRHDDIRDHGTKLVDVIWQMTRAIGPTGDGPSAEADGEAFGAALMYMQPLATHMTGLQSACADRGIIVDLKPTGN